MLDTTKILDDLRALSEQISRAIAAVEAISGGKRRGRPRKWTNPLDATIEPAPVKKRRGRPKGSRNKPKGSKVSKASKVSK